MTRESCAAIAKFAAILLASRFRIEGSADAFCAELHRLIAGLLDAAAAAGVESLGVLYSADAVPSWCNVLITPVDVLVAAERANVVLLALSTEPLLLWLDEKPISQLLLISPPG